MGNLQDAGRAFLFAVIDVAVAGVGQNFKGDGREGEAAQCLGADGVCVEVLEVLEHGETNRMDRMGRIRDVHSQG